MGYTPRLSQRTQPVITQVSLRGDDDRKSVL